MKTTPSPALAASGGRGACHLAVAAGVALMLVAGDPAAANTGFAQQAGYSVTIHPGSNLSFATGYGGQGVTGYSIESAPAYLLLAGPGAYLTAAPTLKATFAADAGRVFTRIDWTLATDISTVEGGGYVQMDWSLAGGSTTASGSTPTWTNPVWFWNATTTLNSPVVVLDDGSFQLDITAKLSAAGYPGGCSSGDGFCARVGAPFIKVWVETAPATAVPEPGSGALLLAGGGALALLLRQRARPR